MNDPDKITLNFYDSTFYLTFVKSSKVCLCIGINKINFYFTWRLVTIDDFNIHLFTQSP